MNKSMKKIFVIAGIAVVSVAALWGVLTLVRSASRQAVNVYAVSDFMTTDYWGNASQSSGMVTTDQLQKIYLSSTQTVSEIYVSEGQSVQKGDKLLSYDTTLSDLDVQMAQIQVDRKELQLSSLKAELEKLLEAKDRDTLEAEKAELEKKLEDAKAAARQEAGALPTEPVPTIPDATQQHGTRAAPSYYEYQGAMLDLADILSNTNAPDEDASRYVVLYTNIDGIAEVYQGVILSSDGSTIDFFTPDPIPIPEDTASGNQLVKKLQKQLEELEEQLAESHTKRELLVMQMETRERISEAEVELKLSQLELQQKKNEVEDGVIYSTLDGIVKAVRDADTSFQNSEAVVEVSGGGGYYITGSMSELSLGNVHVGDTVQINSWMTGTSCEGKILSIEDYPSDQRGWSNGNNNVSYYPFRVFVGEDADLQENDYVDITYQSSGSSDSWYLDNMFIRTDNGKSYVYVRGENGTLEQRFIVTGRDLWGSYTEIRDNLTQEDYIAFPYGQDVVAGAKTQEATIDQLYGM